MEINKSKFEMDDTRRVAKRQQVKKARFDLEKTMREK